MIHIFIIVNQTFIQARIIELRLLWKVIGFYQCVNLPEQQLKFEKFGMISQHETEKVYSDQAFLNVFRNEKKTVENRVEKELPEEQNHGIL